MITKKYIEDLGIKEGDEIKLTVSYPFSEDYSFKTMYEKIVEGNGRGDFLVYSFNSHTVSGHMIGKKLYNQRALSTIIDIEKLVIDNNNY
jgi:hypothetical protein